MNETLRDRLQSDLKTAMKSQDVVSRETIRFTMAALKYAEIEKGRALNDEETLALLQRETKRRVDSIDQFRGAGRQDLVDREEEQLAVLRKYLPTELTDDELMSIVRESIAVTGATSAQDMGKVMPVAIQKASGRADGKRISATVREALGSSSA
ncbi:GatB/YqeY domain-containing protein [soil metagenome]